MDERCDQQQRGQWRLLQPPRRLWDEGIGRKSGGRDEIASSVLYLLPPYLGCWLGIYVWAHVVARRLQVGRRFWASILSLLDTCSSPRRLRCPRMQACQLSSCHSSARCIRRCKGGSETLCCPQGPLVQRLASSWRVRVEGQGQGASLPTALKPIKTLDQYFSRQLAD
jgi:hypothetical protein